MPIGSATDAPYSGSGTPTSIYSLLNGAYAGLGQADSALVALKDSAVPQTMPAENALTAAEAQQIAADFTDTTINGTAPSSSTFAAQLKVGDPNYATQAPQVGAAGTSWSELSQLVGSLGSATGILNSADSASVSSSATITSTTKPFAYGMTINAPSGGYILPSAFSLTFPAGLSVNAALVADEVNVAAGGSSAAAIAAAEANPSGTAIGTVALTTPVAPLADALGATNGTFTGKVYVVTTGALIGAGSATQPDIELWYAPGVYQMGAFPGSLSFPLTLSFGPVTVPGYSTPQPLPMSSLQLAFPAATSPVKSSNCTSVGTVGGTATDEIANLALLFGDTSDGLTSQAGTATAVNLSATPTAVTNKCASVTKKVKNTVTGSMGGLKTGHPTLTLRIKTGAAFGTVRVGLPKGLSFVRSKRLAKEISASSGKVKSTRIAAGKLVITLRKKVKSTTIKARRGAISEKASLVKSIKQHKTKKLSVSVRAGSVALKASIKA